MRFGGVNRVLQWLWDGDATLSHGKRGDHYQGENSVFDCEVLWQEFNNTNDYREILNKCTILSSVLMQRADAFAMGDLMCLKRSTQNDVRGQDKEWQKLISQPNFMQTGTEFMQQMSLYVDVVGWCYAMPIYAEGFTDRPSSIWLLPPWLCEVRRIRKPFYSFVKGEAQREVWFCADGQRVKLDETKLLLFKDKTPICANTWLPESRIKMLEYPITKLISSEESGVTLIQKKGALGIFSNESKDGVGSLPMTHTEKEQLQKDMRQYGLSRNQWQYIITSANLKWQSTVMNVKDLGLSETYLQAAKDIYEMYQVPFPMSAHSDQSTYNNITTADRLFYQNTIIPTQKVRIEQYNNGLNTIDNNIEIVDDYSKVPALQATEKEEADAMISQNAAMQTLYKSNMVTKNQWLEYIGWNKVADPEFDLYYSQTAEGIAAQTLVSGAAQKN